MIEVHFGQVVAQILKVWKQTSALAHCLSMPGLIQALVWPWPNFFIEFGMGLSPELLKILKPSLPIDLG